MKHSIWKKYVLLTLGFLITSSHPSFASTDKQTRISVAVKPGHAVTGWNQRLGETVVELPLVGAMSFAINGVCGDQTSSAIDANTSLNARLCTHADPLIYKAIFNVDVTTEFPGNQNIPLSDFPQIYTSDGKTKALENVKTAGWFQASNGAHSKNYRVKDWLKAKGDIRYVCTPEKNYYEITATNLIPGGLYTLWLFYFDQFNSPPPAGTGGLQPDLAFGGSSANVMVADMDGNLHTRQRINFCPQRWPASEQYQPLNLHLVLHPEGRVYGTVAEQLMKPPHDGGPGIVAIPQLMFTFPVTGQ
jgi:hypothetical protein